MIQRIFMQNSDALPGVNPKRLLRYVAGLLNRCPHWVAALTPDQGHAIAHSPTGQRYLFQIEVQAPSHEEVLMALVVAQQSHEADGTILIAANGHFSPQFMELAGAAGVQLWTMEELDYLVMAADLESNEPLAYLGLLPKPSKTTPAPHPESARQANQGF
jgi:HJR/Mrr/RecB family endonuclease